VCHFSLHPPLVLLGYPMSNSGSLGTATAEPATMNRVSLGHEEVIDSKGKDRKSGSVSLAVAGRRTTSTPPTVVWGVSATESVYRSLPWKRCGVARLGRARSSTSRGSKQHGVITASPTAA
jgi:hypothetical protein